MWEECLEEMREAQDSSQINSLQQEIHQSIVEQESAFTQFYASMSDPIDQNTRSRITDIVSKMRFLYKLKKQLIEK